MARRVAAQPKIVSSRHQPRAKMMEPEAISHHPGREGIVAARNGVRQLETATAMRERAPVAPRQDREKLAWSLLAQSIRVPPDEDSAVLRLGTVHNRHRALGSARMSGVKACKFALERSNAHERRHVIQTSDQLGR